MSFGRIQLHRIGQPSLHQATLPRNTVGVAQKPQPIPPAQTIDAVIDSIDAIVDWSITAKSRLGYFAALYKRITAAVRVALKQGAFEDAARMERFDVAFANRYFDALQRILPPRRLSQADTRVAGHIRRGEPP